MAFDPTCAHVIVGNTRYQVLKPQAFGKRPTVNEAGEMIPVMAPALPAIGADGEPAIDDDWNPVMAEPLQAVDDAGNPLFEMEDYALPREWDEAATMALVNRDHPPELPPVEPEPEYDDISE